MRAPYQLPAAVAGAGVA